MRQLSLYIETTVQNYASSQIKSGSLWKFCADWYVIGLRYSYNGSTTAQLTQSVARVLFLLTVVNGRFSRLDLGFSSDCFDEHNPTNLGAPHWHNILQAPTERHPLLAKWREMKGPGDPGHNMCRTEPHICESGVIYV